MSAGKPDPGVARKGALDDLRDDHWVVPIGRRVIEAHSNAYDFGALIAYAATCAWRDRGTPWVHVRAGSNKRLGAQTPPGGWPALAGTTAPTWRKRRDRAIEIGLIARRTGTYDDGRKVALLCPLVTREEGEQFARVPAAVLFYPGLSRTAKRTYVALATFRNPAGSVRAALATIGTLAGLDRRSVKRGLRELERAGALLESGDARAGRARRWIMPEKCKLKACTPPPESLHPPYGKKLPPPPESLHPPIKKSLQESVQESVQEGAGPSPGSPIDYPEVGKELPPQDDGQGEAPQAPPLTMPLVGEAAPPKKDWPLPAYTGGAKGRLKAIAERAVEIIDHEGTSAAEAETAIAQLVECHALLNGQAA